MEKQIAELKAGLEKLAAAAELIAKNKHHGTPGTLTATAGRINAALEMVKAHQSWLKENPEPKASTTGPQTTGQPTA